MPSEKITVVVPALPGTETLKVAATLKDIDYPKDKIEVIVTEGRNPSLQRNRAIDESTGKIIFFFDDDSEIPKDYIKKALIHYKDQKVDALGGPIETSDKDRFLQKNFGYVIGSYFATQSMSNKFHGHGKLRKATEKELILCNFSIRRNSLGKNRFDERLYPNEENELYNRLMEEGKQFLYDPELKIYRSQRENIYQFARQFFRYGYSRVEHIIIRPKSITPVFLAPPMFVIYLLISTAFITKLPVAFYAPLGLYAVAALISSAIIAIKEKSPLSLAMTPWLYLVVHVSYGTGMITSLLNFKKTTKPRDVTTRRITLK